MVESTALEIRLSPYCSVPGCTTKYRIIGSIRVSRVTSSRLIPARPTHLGSKPVAKRSRNVLGHVVEAKPNQSAVASNVYMGFSVRQGNARHTEHHDDSKTDDDMKLTDIQNGRAGTDNSSLEIF